MLRLTSVTAIQVICFSLCALISSHTFGAEDAQKRGEGLFKERCALCHQTNGAQGPDLAGVVGRVAASQPAFSYSKSLRDSRLTWDDATLDKFLTDPAAAVPGTSMPINVPDAGERRSVIAYLATLAKSSNAATPDATINGAALAADDGYWKNDAPGKAHRIALDSLPEPFASKSAGNNSRVGERAATSELSVPAGFAVAPFATGLKGPRVLRMAPNGDIFVAETSAGRISVLRAADGAREPAQTSVFAEGLQRPFGIAFYPAERPRYVYVAALNSVVRFPYKRGDLKSRQPPKVIVAKLSETTGGHSTRDIAFSPDGNLMYVSVGSGSNVAEAMEKKDAQALSMWKSQEPLGAAWGSERNRADVLAFSPAGKHPAIFATGIRNCVGLTTQGKAGDLWCVTNERDGLGDNLVPDYATRVKQGAFYGWPWYYLGVHEDPRLKGERPDLAGKATVPDLPIQSHSAPIQIAFYTATSGAAAFPDAYRGDAFITLHGSWNRAERTGYKVIRARMRDGVPTGEYTDFLTGFVLDDQKVWGRPAGVVVAHDGSLLVSDDASNTIWRIAPSANLNAQHRD
jgi:glucose/arabinose dehydrogenase